MLQAGVYRMQTVVPKNGDSFIGQAGAVLNGSELVTDFSRDIVNGVTYWFASGPNQPGQIHGSCDTAYPLCGYRERLFVDSRPLVRVRTLIEVTKGACYFDYSNSRIYFIDDPNGHTVEISATRVALAGSASDVTIRGLVIEKYANPAQIGVIGGQQTGNGWIIESNEIKMNYGTGVKVGSAARIARNDIHDNGQLGISAISGALIEDNEIARNNWAGFSMNWEAGGVKLGRAQQVMVRGNYVHDNVGIGIWSDGLCEKGVYENNVIEGNAFHGILHEISHAWSIRRNAIIANGFGTSWGEWLGGAGIQIDESDHVEVVDNFVANNYKGIALTMSVRKGELWADLNNDDIHGNVVVQSKGVAAALYQSVNNQDYYAQKGNRFVHNNYCLGDLSSGETYWWRGHYRSRKQWVDDGQDASGTFSCPGAFITTLESEAAALGTVTIAIFAADKIAVNALQLYVDGSPVTGGTNTIYAYPRGSKQAAIGATYKWDTTQVKKGTHDLQVRAYNSRGRLSNASISFTVGNP